MSRTETQEQLIGLPRVARILEVSYPTASLAAARGHFATELVDGRQFARLSDVLRYKKERARSNEGEVRSA